MRLIGVSKILDNGVGSLFVGIEIFLQNIGEKEQPEDKEHDKQFDENDSPKGFPQSHRSKSFDIKPDYSEQNIAFSHNFVSFHTVLDLSVLKSFTIFGKIYD